MESRDFVTKSEVVVKREEKEVTDIAGLAVLGVAGGNQHVSAFTPGRHPGLDRNTSR